jgi:hypothetical protein
MRQRCSEGPSDYDCYGGSGNGPAYAARVTYRVTGSDPMGWTRTTMGMGASNSGQRNSSTPTFAPLRPRLGLVGRELDWECAADAGGG